MSEPTNTMLMPIFGIATIIATVAICLVIAFPSVVTLVVALATVIGFATGIVALLGRVIGPEDTH
jgi:hypothetical protein